MEPEGPWYVIVHPPGKQQWRTKANNMPPCPENSSRTGWSKKEDFPEDGQKTVSHRELSQKQRIKEGSGE